MPYVTALYAGVLGLLLVVLGARVTLRRTALGVSVGDGAQDSLVLAIRAHANAVEWILPMLLLLLVAELNRTGHLLLHVCGIIFVLGRIAHGVAMSSSTVATRGRVAGAALSFGIVGVLAIWNVVIFLRTALAVGA